MGLDFLGLEADQEHHYQKCISCNRRSDDPKEKVWGVAFEISRDFWDRVLEEKVGYRERGGKYSPLIGQYPI